MENKKQNFRRISNNRVEKILLTLKQLENLTNSSYYEYSKEDVDSIFNEIEEATQKAKKKLNNNLEKKDKEFEL